MKQREFVQIVSDKALPLGTEQDIDILIKRMSDTRVVMLGEASYGTEEFYAWRRYISQRLIQEFGFNFIVIEGGWPEIQKLNRYISLGEDGNAQNILYNYNQWPPWIWANTEIITLAEWMRQYNASLPGEGHIGLYALDVSLDASKDMDINSWNIQERGQRERHRIDTIDLLLQRYGPQSKAIVWAHNVSIGDHKATRMIDKGSVNMGGLAREHYGHHSVALVGFGTHHGTVIASYALNKPYEVMAVHPSASESYEDVFHKVCGSKDIGLFLLILGDQERRGPLVETHNHHVIGAVYDPRHEKSGNYIQTSLSNFYDAFIFIDETTALNPIHHSMRT